MPVLNHQERKRRGRNKNGYTITEMIFVIVITGILASISVPSLINWKHFQTIKTRQLALKANLEQIKSDAKRWGATCTISGADLKSSCTSAVIQKKTSDTFGAQSTEEKVINSTVKDREVEKIFIGTNFKEITFSPRGFIHIDPIKAGSNNATFVLGYQSDSDPFTSQAPELCVVVQHLTGHIRIKQRKMNKLTVGNAVSAISGLEC
ncbi:prepilin-type N-terminal cleavage/methylation domain-containing protein [Synechococcus sp. MU1648]|uniref:pilus assembly FimT family protein n=1 Tax=Synechococcus sp. MU1648 TaxID=2508351 RepID=UPI002025ED2D|nr:prepilin-type N-terminal cleavage/methylation domain-containing protein [Synechococcus sp. MU1648]